MDRHWKNSLAGRGDGIYSILELLSERCLIILAWHLSSSTSLSKIGCEAHSPDWAQCFQKSAIEFGVQLPSIDFLNCQVGLCGNKSSIDMNCFGFGFIQILGAH